jgi:hypothetical protein
MVAGWSAFAADAGVATATDVLATAVRMSTLSDARVRVRMLVGSLRS